MCIMKRISILLLCFFVAILSSCSATNDLESKLNITNEEINTSTEIGLLITSIKERIDELDNDLFKDDLLISDFSRQVLSNNDFSTIEDIDAYDEHPVYGFFDYVDPDDGLQWISMLQNDYAEDAWHEIEHYSTIHVRYFINEDSFYVETKIENEEMISGTMFTLVLYDDYLLYEEIGYESTDDIVVSLDYYIVDSREGESYVAIAPNRVFLRSYSLEDETYSLLHYSHLYSYEETEVNFKEGTYKQYNESFTDEYNHYYYGKLVEDDFVVTLFHHPVLEFSDSFYRFFFDTSYLDGWSKYKDDALYSSATGEKLEPYVFNGNARDPLSSPLDLYIEIDSYGTPLQENFDNPFGLAFTEFSYDDFVREFNVFLTEDKRVSFNNDEVTLDGVIYDFNTDMNVLFETVLDENKLSRLEGLFDYNFNGGE